MMLYGRVCQRGFGAMAVGTIVGNFRFSHQDFDVKTVTYCLIEVPLLGTRKSEARFWTDLRNSFYAAFAGLESFSDAAQLK
jgi:hypothetical protein